MSLVVVADTNVIASATLNPKSPPGIIFQAVDQKKLRLALCPQIITEVREVLQKPYFVKRIQWDVRTINQFCDRLEKEAETYLAMTPVTISPDPNDNMLFACAVEANADYIVSGDKRHVLKITEYQGIKTISPKAFVTNILSID